MSIKKSTDIHEDHIKLFSFEHFYCIEPQDDYMMSHEVYSEKELNSVQITHKNFESWHDRVAYAAVRTLRFFFDTFTGYIQAPSLSKSDNDKQIQRRHKTMNEQQWLRRFIFLESVAGVPGMVGGMSRHMKSLRKLLQCYEWHCISIAIDIQRYSAS